MATAALAAPTSFASAKLIDDGPGIASINPIRSDQYFNLYHSGTWAQQTGSKVNTHGCDDCYWSIPLGIVFPFYGSHYTSACFSSNGFVGLGICTNAYTNSISALDGLRGIAAGWDDLFVSCSNEGWFKTQIGSRVHFRFAGHPFGTSGCATVNFQLTIDTHGNIDLDYRAWGPHSSATVGVSRGTGSALWALHHEPMSYRTGVHFVAKDLVAPVTTATVLGAAGNAGWYTSDTTVVLTATDNRGVSYTRYRVDNGPFTSYTGPIPVGGDGVHSVQYYSVDTSGNYEYVRTTPVRIDTTPPTTAMTSPSPGFVYVGGEATADHPLGGTAFVGGTVTFEASASDATSGVALIEWSLDGVVVGTGSSYAFNADETETGTHTLSVRATDVAGNVGDAAEMTFDSVDTTPPEPPTVPEDPTELIPDVPEDPTELIPDVPEDPTALVP